MSTANSPVKYTCSEDESVSHTVIAAVAEVSNCDPMELPPLYDYIDPEALDTLFHSHSSEETNQDETYLEFTYTTYHITVTDTYIYVDGIEESQD